MLGEGSQGTKLLLLCRVAEPRLVESIGAVFFISWLLVDGLFLRKRGNDRSCFLIFLVWWLHCRVFRLGFIICARVWSQFLIGCHRIIRL